VHSTECADASCDPSLCSALVWYATWWWEWGPSVGEERTSCLLHRIGFWVGSTSNWPDPPSTYASVEQYILIYGILSHLHATQISIPWNSATNQEASQLPLGAQPYGAKVSFFILESILFTKLLELVKHIDTHYLTPVCTYQYLCHWHNVSSESVGPVFLVIIYRWFIKNIPENNFQRSILPTHTLSLLKALRHIISHWVANTEWLSQIYVYC
jgi:hypothetical protein